MLMVPLAKLASLSALAVWILPVFASSERSGLPQLSTADGLINANEARAGTSVEPGTRLVRTIPDDHPDLEYLPSESWDAKSYSMASGSSRTFHRTSMWGNGLSAGLNRSLRFTAPIGTVSCEIYGGPRGQLVHSPGQQKVCIYQHSRPDDCRLIDVEQVYLDVNPDVAQNPVLIHIIENLDVHVTAQVTLTLVRETEGDDPTTWEMSISHLVCLEQSSMDESNPRPGHAHNDEGDINSTIEPTPRVHTTEADSTGARGSSALIETGSESSLHQPEEDSSFDASGIIGFLFLMCLLSLCSQEHSNRTQRSEQAPILPTSSSLPSYDSSHPNLPGSYLPNYTNPGIPPPYPAAENAQPLSMIEVMALTVPEMQGLSIHVLAATVESLTGVAHIVPPEESGFLPGVRRDIMKQQLMRKLWDWKYAAESARARSGQNSASTAEGRRESRVRQVEQRQQEERRRRQEQEMRNGGYAIS